MGKAEPGALVQYIHRLAETQSGADDRTDRELLRLYATNRDEAAFFSLVRRHGSMVWNLCRRALRSEQDAEDAFQATFLVLAQKAGSVRWRESIASWLFAVAQRIACKTRSKANGYLIPLSAVSTAPDPLKEMSARELLAALDEELASLPEKYRGPLILFFLESKTQEETARLLEVSLSTVRRCLGQGREMLQARFARRGLVSSGGLLITAVLSEHPAAASVPMALLGTTIKGASVFMAGKVSATGLVSPRVAVLAEGALQAMLVTKVKTVAVVLLVLAMAVAATGMLTHAHLRAQDNGEVLADQRTGEPAKDAKPAALMADDKLPLPGGNAPLTEWAKKCKGALVATLLEVGELNIGPPGAADYSAKWKVEKVLRGSYAGTVLLSFRVQNLPKQSSERPPVVGKTYILISYEANADQVAVILDANEETLRKIEELLKPGAAKGSKEKEGNKAVIDWGPEKNGVRCAVALASQEKIFAGEPVQVQLLTKNVRAKPVAFIVEGHPLFVFKISVLGPDGKPAPLTAYGHQQMDIAGDGSKGGGKLAPGEENDKSGLLLSRFYDMTQQGEYKVSCSRVWVKGADGSEFSVTSNVLTIKVWGEKAEYVPN